MHTNVRSYLIDLLGIVLICVSLYIISVSSSLQETFQLPASLYNMNIIFLSIIIEALPFVLIGVLIAGGIQIFITEHHIKRLIPKNRMLAVVMSCVVGALFPACECGIVPIVRRLVAKGVPIYAGIGFLLTGPLINPIVILSTYMAFGNDWRMALYRMFIGFFIAVIIAFIISILYRSHQLKQQYAIQANSLIQIDRVDRQPLKEKIFNMLTHSIDEFFDMGKYLFIGALLAAYVQTYIASESFLMLGNGVASSTFIMMGLAYFLSLCSEADAFIGASFSNLFPPTAILAFLIYGPMIDLKNTLMLLSVFRAKFVFVLLFIITIIVFGMLMIVNRFI